MNSSPRVSRARAARRRRTLALLLSLLFVAVFTPFGGRAARQDEAATVAATRAAKGEAAEFVPGEALVRFRSEREAEAASASPASIALERGAGLGMILDGGGQAAERVTARFRRFDGSDIVPGLRLTELSTSDRRDTLAAVAALNKREDVLYAEPNYIWRAKATTPSDERFGEQYAMQRISAPAAWDTTQGSESVVVAVIDSGVNLQHPDLAANAWINPNDPVGDANGDGNLDDDGNGFPDDVNGWDFTTCTSSSPTSPAVCGNNTVFDSPSDDRHGTHVAGIIGARGNNGVGVTGVNWRVSIMSVKVLSGGSGDTADIIRAYNYVRMMRQRGVNVRVTNNSYGGSGFSQAALDAVRALNSAGILFVAAAGNASSDTFSIPEYPTNYDAPNVIGVASTNSNTPDGLSGFSNFSSRLVSMGAPGSGILSTVPNGGYDFISGTSMASPHVAGAAALLLSVAPDISVAHLRGSLAFTGDRLSALQDITTTGRRLNVRAALDAALSGDAAAPAQTALSVVSQTGRSLTLSFAAPGDDGFVGTAADYDFYFVNPALNVRVLMPTSVAPAAGGTQQQVSVDTPLRNLGGTVELVAYDDRGNASTSSLAVSVQQNPATDPYVVTQSAAETLSTGGARLALDGDDKYLSNHALPFAFPFYGQQRTTTTVSSNGVLYFSTPPRRSSGDADDVPSSVAALQGQTMIAGLWEDLEIDTAKRADAGVFVVQPDSSRVIYRWQATTFFESHGVNRGVNHVNFEIELRADGTIIFRYGAGNQNLFPVVAISGGEPSAYDVSTHTSEGALRSLSGAQTVTFTPRANSQPGAGTLQFNTASFAEGEAAGRAVLTVTRAGDASGSASVDYRTADSDTFTVGCAAATGAAFARCDFATTVGTLHFAPGETSRQISVPLVDDAHVEGPETFQLQLSSPSGAALGAPAVITVTISDNDAAGQQNPVVGPPFTFFVRQQYLDFLSREPDQSGLNAWLNVLNNCPNPFTGPEVQSGCDRIHVSGEGFFRSPEFQLKGFYVFRLYKVAFNRLPEYTEIVSDMSFVAGATQSEVFARRAELPVRFTGRQEFQTLYGAMTNGQYVAALLGRYNLQQITTPDPASPDGAAKVVLTQAELTARLDAGALSRAQVLRAVADSDEANAAEFNNTFVAMQYYGYLRRKPDQAGYEAWLRVLQSGDARTMVNGFLSSTEYKLRFGQP